MFLKGDRCSSPKCSFESRNYPPGQHGAAPSRPTEYGRRMREKQKARRTYGLSERQFSSLFATAVRKRGVTGDILFELLERRLDNVVFRLGYGQSRREARQMVRHGHVRVNGKKVNIPSYQCKAEEAIALAPKKLDRVRDRLKDFNPPAWLLLDENSLEGKLSRVPGGEDAVGSGIEYSLIVEYYSQ